MMSYMAAHAKKPILLPEIIRLHLEGRHPTEISTEVGVHTNSVVQWIKEAGYTPVRKEYQRGKALLIDRPCDHCGTTFSPTHSTSRFCSRQCTNDWQRSQVPPKACPCGTTLRDVGKTVGATYCSIECGKKFGKAKGKAPDPANSVTFTCETCGETVTRYKKYGSGTHRFCSNVCANRRPIEHHATPDNVSLDSWWEHLVYAALKVAKIPVERVDRSFHGVEFDGRFYAPDFFLPEQNIYVEVKGIITPEQEAKWIAFRAAGHQLAVVGPGEIQSFSPANALAIVENAAY